MAKYPDKALSAAKVRTVTKPGMYADGNCLYLVGAARSIGLSVPPSTGNAVTWALAACNIYPWHKPERKLSRHGRQRVPAGIRWLRSANRRRPRNWNPRCPRLRQQPAASGPSSASLSVTRSTKQTGSIASRRSFFRRSDRGAWMKSRLPTF